MYLITASLALVLLGSQKRILGILQKYNFNSSLGNIQMAGLNKRLALCVFLCFCFSSIPKFLNPAYTFPIPFGIFREPWTKFYLYYVISFGLLFGIFVQYYLDAIDKTLGALNLHNPSSKKIRANGINRKARIIISGERRTKQLRRAIVLIPLSFSHFFAVSVFLYSFDRVDNPRDPIYMNSAEHDRALSQALDASQEYRKNRSEMRICIRGDSRLDIAWANAILPISLGTVSSSSELQRFAIEDIDFCSHDLTSNTLVDPNCYLDISQKYIFATSKHCFEKIRTRNFVSLFEATTGRKIN
jgi:hypothetical protein